ncbi:hypothetical protein B4U79_14705 [Dinothrombium tinctorium]|uniref:FYVE-type domain-containing protein n=1 Tax=Dinothrombium tinctorium TaxID=1965070 RepID=A0A443QZM4_9ACAR|nr:hypothetical protein B4U79_14705 [Dinothrombium tinctorium]
MSESDYLSRQSNPCSCFWCLYSFDLLLMLIFTIVLLIEKREQVLCILDSTSKSEIVAAMPTPQRKLIKPNLELDLLESSEDEENNNNNFTKRYLIDETILSSLNLEEIHSVYGSVCEEPIVDESIEMLNSVATEAKIDAETQTDSDIETTLYLNLKELKHLRKAVTKAELDCLGTTLKLREDLQNGKICFTCLKTRFKFFGPWSVKCRLCDRFICAKCADRTKISNQQLNKIPISMLVPFNSMTNLNEKISNRRQSNPSINNLSQKNEIYAKSRSNKVKRSLSIHWFKSNYDNSPTKANTPIKICKDCRVFVNELCN